MKTSQIFDSIYELIWGFSSTEYLYLVLVHGWSWSLMCDQLKVKSVFRRSGSTSAYQVRRDRSSNPAKVTLLSGGSCPHFCLLLFLPSKIRSRTVCGPGSMGNKTRWKSVRTPPLAGHQSWARPASLQRFCESLFLKFLVKSSHALK